MSNFDYYSFRVKTVTDKINEEIAFYESCEYNNVHPIKDYLTYLKSRIGIDKIETTTMMHYDNLGNKREIKKMNMDEYAKDMDIFVFKRPWNKLREFHKIMKIKEFIDSLEYGKKAKQKDIKKNKEYLKEEICGGLRNKRFGKNKSEVVYDQENMVILSISSLDYNKKTGLYEIDWDS
ncbi:hypothetical protein QJ856_gp0872 [Tupanvirus deep ocean]|uniref:Uncharacterized protein n=2 Tax=Tupanvirus TaxID=2094720 RepID=A0AC62A8A6_9VIRU|nr:hypothetical protein QJ856_gp0872 [Tupanvirus deep ocean]QKU33883.1 hypothetical protein [Tupanvirus deep ocean]